MNRIDALGGKPCATLSSGTPSARGAAAFSRLRSGGFTRVRSAALIAGVSAYALVLGPVASDPAANATSFSQTTAGAIATTVPDGSCAMAASATGGSGASSGTTAALGGRGAGGAVIGARFAVLPGQLVTGTVAGGGINGGTAGTALGGAGTASGGSGGTINSATIHRGGGGGGSSSISVGGIKVVEAGGGGGGGGAHQAPTAGNGGSGGFAGIGAGVVAPGVTGSVGFQAAGVTVGGGQGGLAAGGGAGGVNSSNPVPGHNGFPGLGIGTGTGGNGGPDNSTDSGGGGGGGYTGGGGGASTVNSSLTGAGGGGGSSFVRATSPTVAATAPTNISGTGVAPTAGGFVNGAAGAVAIDWIPCVYTLGVSKSASPSPVNAGARTVWTVAVTNSGPDPMTRGDTISLADTLPAGPIGSPAPAFRVLTIASSGTGTDTNLDSGAITCTGVTVGASMPSSTVCSRPYSALLAPGAPSSGVRGLNSGETLTITYEQVFANTATATSITNVASTVDRSSTTGTTDIIGVNANRSASTSLSIRPYDLLVTKSASAATVGAGQTFTWTINVTNNGPGDMQGPNETAANPLVVSDAAPTTNVSTPASFTSSGPAGTCTYLTPFNTINCTSGLASGQAQTFTFQQTVNAGAPGNAVISNTAGVTDYTTAGGEGSDSSAASVTVSAADLAVTKTDGVTSVNANGTTSYTVVVTNNGPSSVTGAMLTDAAASGLSKISVACAATPGQCTVGTTPSIAQLEAGYALPTLASGQTYQLTVNVNVTALSGNVSNIATIAAPSGTSDPTPGNNSANDTNSVTPVADLSITKTNGTTSVNAGGTTTYTITVTNGGPSSVTGATLTDAAAAGLTKTSVGCSATPGQCVGAPSVASLESGFALPALASGQTYQLTVAASVTATSGSVANMATIAVPSGTTDPGAANNSATDTDTVTPAADLSVTKTNGAASVNAGGTTSYTITVTNGGPSSVTGATLADPAVAGLTKTSVACSATPGQCVSAPSVASFEGGFALPALASGQTYQITVAANVTATSGSVANTATVAVPSGTTDPTAANDSATDTDTVTPVADLSISKTDGVASVNAGGTTSYTITVTNGGPSSVTGATLADPVAAGLTKTSVVCSATPGQCVSAPSVASLEAGFALPAIASGQTYQITVAANVTAMSGSVANTATIAVPSGTTDPGAANNSATDTNTVTPVADLAVTKTNGVTSVMALGTTSYTVTVTNNGPSAVTGATLTDPIASGLTVTSVACSAMPGQCALLSTPTIIQLQAGYALPALASGQTYQLIVNATVTATSGSVANTATIVVPSGTTDPTGGNNSATDTDTVAGVADLAVTKTDGITSVNAGGTTSYTVTVTNIGPSAVTGATLTDSVAAGLTVTSVACAAVPGQCTAGTTPTIAQLQAGYALPAIVLGQTYVLTVNASVTATSGSVANTATIAVPSGVSDPVSGNDSATDTNTVTPVSELAITKTNGVSVLDAGGTTTYTITVTNNGPSTATGATLSDPAVSGLTISSIACSGTPGQCTAGTTPTAAELQVGYALPALTSGQTYQLLVTFNVAATDGTVSNVATVAPPAGTLDGDVTNNIATDADTVTPVADLSVTKTNGAASVNAGGTTSYTITVTNGGPSPVTGATLSDPAVAGLTKTSVLCSATPGQCSSAPSVASLEAGVALPALASGQTYQLTISANVTATFGSVANSATVAAPSGTTDPIAGNNSATDTDTVTPVADLAVTKTNGATSVNAGGTTSYTVTVTNNGPSPVTGAILTDTAAAGLTKTSVVCSATPGQCSSAPSVASLEAGFALPALASGQAYQLTVAASVTATSGSVANTASVAPPSGTIDPTPANDSVTDTDAVTAVADLAVTKTNGASSVSSGGTTTYTITVTNNGPSPATGATLSDPAVAGLIVTSVACSATPGQCTTAPTVAQLQGGFALPALASGQTYQIDVTASVTATSGSVANTASIAPPSGTIDPTPANDNATDTDTVTPVADLSVTKTDGVTSVNAGGSTAYTLTITNGGPSSVTGATLTDPAATGLTVTSAACSATPGQCVAPPTVAQLQAGYALPALGNGDTYQLVVNVTVTATSGSVANTATVAVPLGTIDPAAGNDTATDTNTVNPIANLVTVKTRTSASATPSVGDTVTFQIAVTNNGPSAATNVSLTDTLPAGLTATGANGTVSQGTYVAGTGVWTIGSLANGVTATLTLSGTVNTGQGGQAITNTTTAATTADQPDPTTTGDDLSETVNVFLPAIVAANDSVGGVNGASGASNVLNAFTGDTLNGVAATAANTTVTVASGFSVPAGLTFDTATGNVSVTAGTAAGTYTFDYTICEVANPANCDNGTISVTVVAAPIVAANDNAGGVNGANGGTNVLNAFTGDTLNGAPATAANTTLTVASGFSVPAGLSFDTATGNMSVAAGTAAGTYTFDYTICETLNPTNCDNGTISVTVVAAPIVAADDSVGGINGASGATNVLNAFTGDTLNGVAATAANTTLTVATGFSVPAGLTFDTATGNVSVVAGTAAGTYAFDYTNCEILNPTNCDNGTISVTVVAAAIVAADDSVGGVNGASGAANVLNAFTSDTLNGVAATVANTTLTVASGFSVPAGLTFDTATGNVSVAAGTAAGAYTFDYTICENLNPANCDNGTISVTVVAAPIVANNDTPPAVVSGIGNANLINAFSNDTLNGAAANVAAITATVTVPASNPGVSLDTATGVVSVAAGVPAGDYTIQYQICETLNPTNCSGATIFLHVDPAVSAVTGTVYTDSNGNQALDFGEPRQPNWIVEIFRNGTLVGTTTTNGTGDYTFTGLLSGPGYSIQFRNPENNVVFDVITGLTLADNVTVVDQNLPIDPSGVVYDSLTRNPVAGAVLTMADSGGAPLPAVCFLSATQQGQQTGASGQYQFDIIPGAAAQCPVGETVYRIVVTPPAGYSSPSTVLVPQAGPFDPTGLPSPALVGASANAPAGGDPTVYYLTFRLASGDPDVIFNHIPIDPFLGRPPLTVSKTSIKRTASVGDLVPYTITVRNTEVAQRAGVTVVDILPPGLKYVPGSATVNGVLGEPAVADRELTWTNQIIPANGSVVYKIVLVVGAGVTGGDRINTGLARNGADNSEISNRGQAVVAIVASTVFDCSEIIGKVYDDRNGNGYQDEGEPGIPAARLATVNGLLVTTDEFGRYHITCVAVPDARIGSNFVLKLDPRSVPAGYAPTIDNPQSIRLTRGKMSELNFGVKKADVREVNLDARAFVANGTALKPELAAKLKLLAEGNPQPLVVRVNYRLGANEDAGVADVRLTQLKAEIEACFGAVWDEVRPVFETNMDRADGEPTP